MYTITIKFKDENQPDIVYKESTSEMAFCTLDHACKQFASISMANIVEPGNMIKHCFNAKGEYLFTAQPTAPFQV